MSLADLRKELKALRKEAMPVPISRLKKTDVAMELERLRGRKKVEEVPSAPAVLEKIAKPKVVVEKAPKAEKVKPVVEKKVVVEKEAPYVPSKFVKGSQEARDRMALIRSKKGAKKSDE